jgi:pimeloyl-ACP methyl ester carboxylesterase
VRLTAGYVEARGQRRGGIDAVILNPGTSATFAFPALVGIADALASAGYAALSISTRGHGLVWRDAANNRFLGAAYETVEDCWHDFDAAFEHLRERGHRRIALLGHSLGGAKALWYSAHRPHALQAGTIACSPPRWSAEVYGGSERGAHYWRVRKKVEAFVHAGRGDETVEVDFPLGKMPFRAAGWLEKYGAEKYNMANYADRISVPLLHVLGDREVGDVSQRNVADDLMRLATRSAGRKAVLIPGGDHIYTGVVTLVGAAIVEWLNGIA